MTRSQSPASGADVTERNRAVVHDFVELFYRRRDVRLAFERHVAPDYIQHNPGLPDGRDAAIAALEPKFSAAGFHAEIKRILVDGDLAAIHLHARSAPHERGGAVADSIDSPKAASSSTGTCSSPFPSQQPTTIRCSRQDESPCI
jgi:predicted SnoaL-like aldol condensation-catalyzing enzyme